MCGPETSNNGLGPIQRQIPILIVSVWLEFDTLLFEKGYRVLPRHLFAKSVHTQVFESQRPPVKPEAWGCERSKRLLLFVALRCFRYSRVISGISS